MAGVDEFLRNLQRSNLLTPEQWKVVRREATGHPASGVPGSGTVDEPAQDRPSPVELARKLVEQGFLTPWQSEMLLQGKKAFFIGKYRLLDCIGSGGMGAVFKALHGELDRIVAIKIMSAEVVKDRRAVARFRQEVQALAALDDPHIVAAYDASSAGGLHYLVMEYIDGHDLGYLIRQNGRLPVDWSCECIRQAALGLQYAHEKGMVHRDIKPTNLLVTKDSDSGRPLVKILDLGLARGAGMRGGSGSLTQIGQFLGTPDYVSPEQGEDVRRADIRSDIFSLGCTFFRMLTAQLPFQGESVIEKLAARETTDAPRVSSLRNDVPPELDAVVAKMLARDPKARYQTPQELAQALAPLARRATPLPAPPSEAAPRERAELFPDDDSRLEEFFKSLGTVEGGHSLSVSGIASRLKRVSPRIWLAGAGVMLALVAGYFVWSQLSAAELVIVWPLVERDGAELRVNARPVKLSEKPTLLVHGRPGTWNVRATREGYEPIEQMLTLRSGESFNLPLPWQATPRTLRQLKLQELKARVSAAKDPPFSRQADAVRTAILSFLGEYAGSPEARGALELLPALKWPLDRFDGTPPVDVAWQVPASDSASPPQAKPVAVIGDGRLKFWNTITAVAVSPDGALVAGASRDRTVQVFDPADGRRRQLLLPPVNPQELAFSPDGSTLAVAGTAGPVTLWNAAAGTLISTLPETSGPLAFSGDGRLIAVRAARQEIALWDARSGELRRTMQGHSTGVLQGLVFSHAGKMLASYGSDSSVLLWDVASGQERRRFPNSQVPLFSPDDDFLAAGATNGDLMLWDTRTGETQRTLDDGGHPLAFDKRGATLLSKRQGRAILWDLVTGDEIRTIVEVPELAAVSPDGKWLAGAELTFGELRLWNLPQGASRRAVTILGPASSLAFTADSSTVIVGTRENGLQFFAAETGAEHTPAGLPIGTADLSPDGQTLAVRRGDRVELVDVTTGKTERALAGNAADLEALVYSPDGRFLAGFGGWGFFQTSLRLWDAASGKELPMAGEPLGNVRTIAFSSDTGLLACAGDSRLVTLWNLKRQTVEQTLDDFSDRVTAVAFHPDGRRLAVACQDQTVVLWDWKANGGKTLARRRGLCRQLVFSSDGKLLGGAADEQVLVWNVERGKLTAELTAGDGGANTINFDPAGTMLATAGDEGVVRLWNNPHSERRRDEPDRLLRVGPPYGSIRRVLFGLDGRHLLTVNGNGTVYVLRLAERSP
jgi:WD40 repeat protein/serine/threonine protein kinase